MRSPKPWDIGGAYSRPLCRRLVEEASVPREIFGVSKPVRPSVSFAARTLGPSMIGEPFSDG
jgi:hypothetical protein